MVIKDYNAEWPAWFMQIKAALQPNLPHALAIEHVGSTSIPGMCAKPIIDIDVVIADYVEFNYTKDDLERIGYRHVGDQGIFQREAFKRQPNLAGLTILDEIPHHLYVCAQDNPEYQRHILFRDYLRQHPQAVEAYRQVKQEILSKVGQDNRQGYVDMKETQYGWFFAEIIDKAVEE
jgi:GrpB-like predicted nucleotidyltransferase (UPF0157 family)